MTFEVNLTHNQILWLFWISFVVAYLAMGVVVCRITLWLSRLDPEKDQLQIEALITYCGLLWPAKYRKKGE